jgi:hypothetical protein
MGLDEIRHKLTRLACTVRIQRVPGLIPIAATNLRNQIFISVMTTHDGSKHYWNTV